MLPVHIQRKSEHLLRMSAHFSFEFEAEVWNAWSVYET